MEPGIGTAAGATDIAGQRAVLRRGGIQKERVIVPWAGRRHWVMGFPVPTLRYLMALPVYLLSKANKSKSTVRTSPRLGSSFLDNPGWDSRWFHRPEAAHPGFSPVGTRSRPNFWRLPVSEFTRPRL